MTSALLFPGLDALRPAQLGKFLLLDPVAAGRLAIASETLGYPVLERFAAETDRPSEATRVAFLVSCVSLADWARREWGVEPAFCLGLSQGEQAALAYAGCLSFPDAVRLTAEIARAELAYFATTHQDLVTQLVIRVAEDRLTELLAGMTERGEWHEVSGWLDDGAFMVTMSERHLGAFTQEIGRAGGYALQAMRPPAHAHLFSTLRDRLEAEVVSRYKFTMPHLPMISDADGSPVPDGAAVRTMLLEGFVRPLRWRETASSLRDVGVSQLYVVGPDRFWHRLGVTTRMFEVTSVNQAAVLRHRRSRVGDRQC